MRVIALALLAVAAANVGALLFQRDSHLAPRLLPHHETALAAEILYTDFTFKTPKADTLPLSALLSARDASDDGPSSAAGEGRPGGYRTVPTTASMRRRVRTAHGTIMALAFVIFLPLGAIVMHVTHRVWIHAVIQIFAYSMVLTGLGLGVWLGLYVRYLDYAHTVIGMSVVTALFLQLCVGIWAHRVFLAKKRSGQGEKLRDTRQRRIRLTWGSAHRWVGRGLIALGIANGGAGLKLAGNTRAGTIAYGVVAGVVGSGVLGLFFIEAWRGRTKKSATSEAVAAQVNNEI